ncbi:MAG: hypothetical protein IJ213_02160 [Bacteroidales bacterium]|nr:hypothetical protein [Bacteroidales bacterium]
MKKIFLGLSIIAMGLMLFSSCSNKSDCECSMSTVSPTESKSFTIDEYEGDCEAMTSDNLPDEWKKVLLDNSSLKCREK